MVSAVTFLKDNDLNGTYITLNGFVQLHKFRYVYFVIMLAAYFLIILLNSSIVFVIWTNKILHEPMYMFIAALMVNCVLFSTAVYPKLLIDFLSERQTISYSACLLQCQLYYSFFGSEFLLLAAMAFDRYVSICKPLRYPTIMRRTIIIVILVLAWLFPALHFMGLILQYTKLCNFNLRGIYCNNYIIKLYCYLSRAVYIYGLVVIFNLALLPLSCILFTYTRILLIAYRSSWAVRKKAVETCLPHLLVLINLACLAAFEALAVRVENKLSKTATFLINFQVILYHPLFNPVMYGLKMNVIHKHLKKMFLRD